MNEDIVVESKINKNNVKKNYFYLLIGNVATLLLPLISTPYIARVLTSDGTGKYSFALSIATYFILFANLGFANYGNRIIAKYQGDKYKQSVIFYEIIIVRLIPVFVSLLTFLGIVFILSKNISNFNEKYNTILLIMSIQIIAYAFRLYFFFYGNEAFKLVSIFSLIMQIIVTASYFIFIKTSDDLIKYTIIKSVSEFLNFVFLFPFIFKYLCKVKISDIHPLHHLPAAFILFLPTIAISIYTSLDKTLIGFLVPNDYADYENGCYDKAEQLVKIGMTIITVMGNVMLPKNANLYANGKILDLKKNVYFSSRFVFFLGVPIMLGFILLADNFIPLFLGPGYDKAILLFKMLSPLVLILGFSNVFGTQYLLAIGKDFKYTISVISAAVFNLGLNFLLIPSLYSYGAVIATEIAEIVATIIMLIFSFKEISIKKIIASSIKYIFAGIIMFGICFIVSKFILSIPDSIVSENATNLIYLKNCFIIITIGVFVYFFALILMKEKFTFAILNSIKKKWLSKKKSNQKDYIKIEKLDNKNENTTERIDETN